MLQNKQFCSTENVETLGYKMLKIDINITTPLKSQ